MNINELHIIEQWFRDFVSGYNYDSREDRASIELKKEHTWRVADNMSSLAESEQSWADPLLSRAIGVLHDAGRFPQYDKFRTFRDADSVNHGLLGSRVLMDSGVLDALASLDMEILLAAVKYHNAFGLPCIGDDLLRYVRLIRDADKLDVWRVLADHYELPGGERPEAVGQGLAESPGCSVEAVEALGSGRMVPMAIARNFNDMRLLYVSWAYDMNYPAACSTSLDRGDLRRIASGLPDEPGVNDAVERAFEALSRMAGCEGAE